MKKFLDKYLPAFARLPLIIAFLVQILSYVFARLIARNFKHYDFTLAIDNKIPFIPIFIIIYWACYFFWAINYILCCRFNKKQAYTFVLAHLMGMLVCFLFYIFLPTTMARPEVEGNDFFSKLMRQLYYIDEPNNLLPSIHCFVSWMCYIGMRGDKRYSLIYRIFSLIFALLVCFSTLATKQHVIVDCFAGVILAEVCFASSKLIMRGNKKCLVKKEE